MTNIIPIDEQIEQLSEETDEVICQDLVNQLDRMTKDRDKKCASAKEQLIEQLKVTADKYRTATGVMEALRVIRTVFGDHKRVRPSLQDELANSNRLAGDMIVEICALAGKAESLGYAEMDKLCDGAYKEDFISNEYTPYDLCFELMRLDLCRNIGPAAEDMVGFINRVQEEVNAIHEKLDSIDKDWAKKYKPEHVEEA